MKTRVKLFICVAAAVFLAVFLCSCDSPDTVMKIGDHEVSRDEYSYYLNNYKIAYPDASGLEIKQKCEDALRLQYALWEVADDIGYKLNEADKAVIEANINEAIDNYGGEKEFKEALEQGNMTEDVYRLIQERTVLEQAMRELFSDEAKGVVKLDDETVEKDVKKNFCLIHQICIVGTEDGERTRANEILSRIQNGEDFDTLAEKYNESNSVEYCFTHGMLDDAAEKAAFSLGVGEISDVVECDGTFNIIKRLELTDEYINSNFEDLRYYYSCRKFNEKQEKYADGFKVTYTSAYYDLMSE